MLVVSSGNIKYVLWGYSFLSGDSDVPLEQNNLENEWIWIISSLKLLFSSSYCPPREADSGVVTDAGPDPGLSSNNSRLSVLSTVSASVSLDNLYLGEEADTSSDQSNR